VQAKADGDAPGASSARPDRRLGQFLDAVSVRIYTAAQAIVSLTPMIPRPVAITEVKQEPNISDDFLYLLVKNADCETDDPKRSATALGQQPSRWPRFFPTDRFHGYSQDIAAPASIYRLRTRTLSRVQLQAIVRVSDPSR